jgi:molybdopterin converting factor small subunit
MRIRVVFYGGLKQDVGTRDQLLDLPQDSLTMQDLVEVLKIQYPKLALRLGTVAYVVGDEIVEPQRLLHDGDEAGLLPPVSGG